MKATCQETTAATKGRVIPAQGERYETEGEQEQSKPREKKAKKSLP